MLNRIAKADKHSLLRSRYEIEYRNGNLIRIAGKSLINFCSNDYLQIAAHDDVKKAFAESASQFGLGSSASALVSGYSHSHAQLEKAFAVFLKRDRALLFNSGYHANVGVITAFANRHSTVVADKYCHASLNDGALLSRAKYYRYLHNNMQHAEALLHRNQKNNSLLLTESIFSMQGDIAPVQQLKTLARKYNAMLIIDDAHGLGVLGNTGAGITEFLALTQQDIACLITPLGKALGSVGAIVSGSESTIETLLQFSRTYRYSTALPPAICEASLVALNILSEQPWRRVKLQQLCQFFIKECKLRNLKLISDDCTPIKSILVSSSKVALNIQRGLITKGLFVSCIRPNTVPAHLTCIRISLNCMHGESQIIYLLDQLKEKHEHYTKTI
jgi:8-amino-7-oxononanoate synthase